MFTLHFALCISRSYKLIVIGSDFRSLQLPLDCLYIKSGASALASERQLKMGVTSEGI